MAPPLPIIQCTFGKLLNTLRLNYQGGGGLIFLEKQFSTKVYAEDYRTKITSKI